MEKFETKNSQIHTQEFKKDFGGNCRMCLCPLKTENEIQMVINWILEADLCQYNYSRKIIQPNHIPSQDQFQYAYMIKMEPSIPVAKVQIVPTTEDVISLQQSNSHQHFMIRPIFNPKFSQHPTLSMNAIRMACFYSFIQLQATQTWMEVRSYQTNLIQMVKEIGFQQQGHFFGQAAPIIKFKMTLNDFKKKEFFLI